METISLSNSMTKGLSIQLEGAEVQLRSIFGLSGGFDHDVVECGGLVYLDTDAGRYEGGKWTVIKVERQANSLLIAQEADGIFRITIQADLDEKSGIISWRSTLENLDEKEHLIYACLPRFVLKGGNFRLYGQYSSWCAENQGGWQALGIGNHVLTNSAGRSSEGCAPFGCVQNLDTGLALAVHVLPIGDWTIKCRRISGHRTSYTLLEAGLSDSSLRMELHAGEVIELPELLLYGFEGTIEESGIQLQRYLLERFPGKRLPGVVYNSWFLDYDVVEEERLKQQVRLAKQIGCKTFVVDAGWFGKGLDWENQVGCWEECTDHGFMGRLTHFADFVRQEGLTFGIWMEPERACEKTAVYQEHPSWFLKADTILFDLRQEAVISYLADAVTKVIRNFGAGWLKLDYNTNMQRDLLGDNFYSYYLGEKKLMQEIQNRNPECTLEGCSSGGMRTDIRNVMGRFHGHFISDSVHPYEILRMRQHAAVRLLPEYLGSWLVLQEVDFPISTYTNRDWKKRRKLFSCGDAWWEHTVDVDLDFAIYANQMGEFGLSGDLSSLSEQARQRLQRAAEFYEAHRAFMSRSICHLLTMLQPLNSICGWSAMQYENVDGKGSIIYVFRMVDDADTFYVYPKNLEHGQSYHVYRDEDLLGVFSAEALNQNGIRVTCGERYRACMLQIIPVDNSVSCSGKGAEFH